MLEFSLSPFTPLTTPRLHLRQIRPSDAPRLHELRSDPEVMRYLDRPFSQSLEDAQKLIQNIEEGLPKNENITWVLTLPEDDLLIGTILLFKFDKENHRGEVGYMLMKEFHRRGYMQEAITAVIEYGFRVLNLHTMQADINPHNAASRAILEKNGFVQEAHYKENYYYEGKFLDTVIFSRINPYH